MDAESNDNVRNTVRNGYADIARDQGSCCCGNVAPDKLAEAIGYSNEELNSLPEGANMGLSCGNPTAIADLKPGQIVLDLGSGGVTHCDAMHACLGDMSRDIIRWVKESVNGER